MDLKYPTTSKTLLDRIAAGDEISWDEFYTRYGKIVRSLAKFKGLDDSEAEDVCQKVVGRNGMHRYNNMDHSMLSAIEAAKAIRSGSADKSRIWDVNTEEEHQEISSEKKPAR